LHARLDLLGNVQTDLSEFDWGYCDPVWGSYEGNNTNPDLG